ncbi:uncharacterized protein LOC142584945 isoform X1 [Dermacentor variabilis]|uniref:uncharacterized protein LOC142584945 isoform X1 n=1 Tax=Dermacentor variabilis TaxID=34621 RepID=UPI003F5B2FA7
MVSNEMVPRPAMAEKPVPVAAEPKVTTPAKNSRTQRGDTMPVACVTGENTKEAAVPPDGVCDYLVFAHVALDESNSHFVDTGRNDEAFQAFMKAAAGSSATRFLLSVNQRDSADFAFQLRDEARAARVLGRYRATRIRGYGFAHYDLRYTDADRTKLNTLHKLLVTLRRLEGGEELAVFMGVRFVLDPPKRQNRLKELIKDVSKSLTFLVLITHVTPSHTAAKEPCIVDPIGSWTSSSFNNQSHLSMREAAELVRRQTGDAQRQQSFLLSSSMAVVYYDIDEDADRKAELKDVPCTGAVVSSYATVCNVEMGWKVGAEGIGDHVRYEQFAEMGKWRTYKTRPHLAAEACWPALLAVLLLSAALLHCAPVGVAPLSELPQDLQQLQQQHSALPVASRAVVSTVSSVIAISTTTSTNSAGATTRSPTSSSTSKPDTGGALEGSASSTFHLLDEFMDYNGSGQNLTEPAGSGSSYRLGYTVDTGGSLRKFRYEERTPEGAIVGEFGFHKNDGVIRGVRYTAEPGVHPKVLYEALVKFFSL